MNISLKNLSKINILMISVLVFAFAFAAGTAGASLTFDASSINSSSGTLTVNNGVVSDVTRATGATGSFQNFAGDVTYQGAAGGTSAFHAGVMGHFHGSALTN